MIQQLCNSLRRIISQTFHIFELGVHLRPISIIRNLKKYKNYQELKCILMSTTNRQHIVKNTFSEIA